MSRIITVYVTDSNGYGVSGAKVYAYQDSGNYSYTDNNGKADVVLSTDYSDSIYVDGFEIWSGSASDCSRTVNYRKS